MSSSIKGLSFLGTHATFRHLTKSETTIAKACLFYRLGDPWRFSLLNSKNRHTPTLAEKFPATLLPAWRPASRKTLPDRNRPIENKKLVQAGIQLQSLELQAFQTKLKLWSCPHNLPLQCYFMIASLVDILVFHWPTGTRVLHPCLCRCAAFMNVLPGSWKANYKVIRFTTCKKSHEQLIYKFEQNVKV